MASVNSLKKFLMGSKDRGTGWLSSRGLICCPISDLVATYACVDGHRDQDGSRGCKLNLASAVYPIVPGHRGQDELYHKAVPWGGCSAT